MMRTILGVSLIVVTSLGAFGQSPQAAPAFEVASVKPNKSGSGGSGNGRRGSVRVSGGGVMMENVSLWKCIGMAYGLVGYHQAPGKN